MAMLGDLMKRLRHGRPDSEEMQAMEEQKNAQFALLRKRTDDVDRLLMSLLSKEEENKND